MRPEIFAPISPLHAFFFLFMTPLLLFTLFKGRSIIYQILKIPCSIVYHWYQSIKIILSLSLSPREQSKFEEQFKYLIVTSSLFNELNQQQPPRFESCSQASSSTDQIIILVTHLLHILSAVAVYHYNYYKTFIYGLVSSYLFSCFFLYRHNKHVQVRRIHFSALDSMHEIISLSQKSDIQLTNLMDNPSLAPLIKAHIRMHTRLINELRPLTDLKNLSRLKEMYMSDKLAEADLLVLSLRAKRREYLLHLLALDVMSNNHAAHYGKNWKKAIQINKQVVSGYNQFNQQLAQLAFTELKPIITEQKSEKPPSRSYTIPSSPTSMGPAVDKCCISLMQKIAVVERQLEETQSKLFAYRQDLKYLFSGRVATTQSLNRISKRSSNIDDTLKKMMNEWNESKVALNNVLKEQQDKENNMLPSPPSSPVGQELHRSLSLNNGGLRRANRSSYYL
ncbi:hypothetical protein BY458DRAFT_519254 [Sporodiniella umbellata]|nr:hypothetical protein BY458DRAFT_519254 [Sporodiniella umbellata]